MADIAVVVAHPDDEVLGFGGAIAHHAQVGDGVHILIMATGLAARTQEGVTAANALDVLRNQAQSAADILGATSIEFADFPDNRMDSVALLDVVKCCEEFISRTEATTVYTHHMGDLNIDHQTVARSVSTACRPQPGAKVTQIYAGEVNSSTEWALPGNAFEPNEYLDISKLLDLKLRALACYKEEMRDWPHPRSIRGVEVQAQWRGTQVGLDAAEAYRIIRRIRC